MKKAGVKKKLQQISKKDIDRLAVRVLSNSAWLKKKAGLGREAIHRSQKKKPPRHKKRAEDQD